MIPTQMYTHMAPYPPYSGLRSCSVAHVQGGTTSLPLRATQALNTLTVTDPDQAPTQMLALTLSLALALTLALTLTLTLSLTLAP